MKLNYNIVLFLLVGLLSQACDKEQDYGVIETPGAVFNGTTLDYIDSHKGTFDSLYKVMNRLGDLNDKLAGANITLFAPTNNSFKLAFYNLNKIRTERNQAPLYIKDVDSAQLDTLMSRYIIKGVFTTDTVSSVTDGVKLPTVKYDYVMRARYGKENASGFVEGGPQFLVFSDPKGSNFIDYWINTTTDAVNIKTDNGIVHVLSSNHDFGFNEFIERLNK